MSETITDTHTAECADLAALIDLITWKIRVAYDRGEIPYRLATAAQSLTLAQSEAHRTCLTHAAIFAASSELRP